MGLKFSANLSPNYTMSREAMMRLPTKVVITNLGVEVWGAG